MFRRAVGTLERMSEKNSEQTTADQDVIGGTHPDPDNPASKDPSDWVTGDEPITGAQRSYLDTLAKQAGEELPGNLTKAEASQHIDRLQQETGRGASDSNS
jgi:hypothetical protein